MTHKLVGVIEVAEQTKNRANQVQQQTKKKVRFAILPGLGVHVWTGL